MPQLCGRDERSFIARRFFPALLSLSGFLVLAASSNAQITLGPVSVGAGLQTSFTHTGPDQGSSTDSFQLDHARIYVSGPVTESISFMLNTDYQSSDNKLQILDAAAQFHMSDHVNIWAGRFLEPSDRAALAGPFYSNMWGKYTDGVQDGYPFVYQGRDNGVMYWGDFLNKKMKVAFGAFDGGSATGDPKVLVASRVQFDFWDKEDGYYLNETYYGDKNLLSLGGANQVQSGHTATTIDFLMERKLKSNGGVVSIEGEFADYNRLGGYDGSYAKSKGGYGLGSYLFPKMVPIGKLNGKFEILGKFATADFNHGKGLDYNQKTTEINFNYVIKQFKARVMTFYRDTRFDKVRSNFWQAGVGLQIQI